MEQSKIIDTLETYHGGETPDLGFFLEVWVYMRGRSTLVDLRAVHEAAGRTQGGGRAPTLVASSRIF